MSTVTGREDSATSPTSGSWVAFIDEESPPYWRVGAGARCVASGCFEADARLIAAAPELLEALKDIVRAEWTTVTLQDMTPQHRRRLETARAAIAKAGA